MRGPTGRPPDGPRRRSNVIPAPTAAPIRAAVSRSYCCSRSSSSSMSGSDARARFLPTVGSGFVVVPIAPLLLVKCLINSGSHSANRRRSSYESRFRFLLHDFENCIELVDPVFRRTDRLLQPLIHRRHCLTHLLDVDSDRSGDVVHVVRDRTRVSHQRVDIAVNLVQHVADLLVTLSKIPG